MLAVKALPCVSCGEARDTRGDPVLSVRFVREYRCERCRRRYHLTPGSFAELLAVPWDRVESLPLGRTARNEALAGLTEAQRADVDGARVGLGEILRRPA